MATARNLGSWIDSKMTMVSHVTKACNPAIYFLYNMRRIRKYFSEECTKTLVHAFISGRMDYCNSVLYGLPEYQIKKLQRVQNMSARVLCNETKYCRITPLLVDLHWLPIKFRIEFKFLWNTNWRSAALSVNKLKKSNVCLFVFDFVYITNLVA